MGAEPVCTLLHTHRGRFEKQLTEALAKGWAGWTQQAAELNTFYADHENQMKARKGFFKLNNKSIAIVCKDFGRLSSPCRSPFEGGGSNFGGVQHD